MSEEVDLYDYRYYCYADGYYQGGEFDDFNCTAAFDTLLEAYECFDNAEIYTPEYCVVD